MSQSNDYIQIFFKDGPMLFSFTTIFDFISAHARVSKHLEPYRLLVSYFVYFQFLYTCVSLLCPVYIGYINLCNLMGFPYILIQ